MGKENWERQKHQTWQAEPTEKFDGSLWLAEKETIQRQIIKKLAELVRKLNMHSQTHRVKDVYFLNKTHTGI